MHAAPSLIKPPAGPVRLRNRWRPDHFIHIEHESLEVGAIEPGWRSACWSFRTVENSPFVVIANSLHADHCLQMCDTGLICGLLQRGGPGTHWYLERIKGTRFVRFRNRWQHECYIHCESGSLEATPVGAEWQSGHWECA